MNPRLRNFLSPPSFKGWLKSIGRSILLAYLLLMVCALFANQLLFHPPDVRHKLPTQVTLHAADGNDITAFYLPNPQAAYVVLFSYGNGEDLEADQDFLYALRRHGWAVCGYDYPGYGLSTGQPSEQGCIAAINAAYDYLTQQLHIPPERIVLYGRSLGSGPTVDLASRRPVGGLILEGAYLSIFRVVTHYRIMPWDIFNNIAKISAVHAPLLSIHAQNDHTIPFWQGQELNDVYSGPKQHFWAPGADHNTILSVAADGYWAAVEQFRQSLPLHTPLSR
jgi:pimeloyl-ACP methyl ester carboxylesterase